MSQIVNVPFEEELKKNGELKKSDIENLKEWGQKQPHLPQISDSSLALFLHSNYYRMEPTKVTIDNYYTIRMHAAEIFTDRYPLNIDAREALDSLTFLPLEQTTKEGYNILFIKLIDPDPSKFLTKQFLKAMYMVLDLWIYRSGTTKGHLMVLDVQDVSLSHAIRISPVMMRKSFTYLQEGLPVRLKGIHYVNLTAGMEAILKIIRPFLKKELLDTTYLHSSIEQLTKFIPIEYLPNELGGKAGPLMKLHEAQIKELNKYRNWFLEEESQSRIDETKRPGKAKTDLDLFGADGNFSKVDID